MTLTLVRVITLFLCIAILAPGRSQAADKLKYQRGNLKQWRGGDVTQVKDPLPPLVYDVGTFGKLIRWNHKPQSHKLLRADGMPYSHYKLTLIDSDQLALESLESVDPAESNHLLELAKIQVPQGTTVTLVFDSNTFEVKYPRRLSFWKKHVNIRVRDENWGFRLYLKPIQVIFSFKYAKGVSWLPTWNSVILPPLALKDQEYHMICYAEVQVIVSPSMTPHRSVYPILSIVAAEKTTEDNSVAAYLVPIKDGKLRAVEEKPFGYSLVAYHDTFYDDTKMHCRDRKNRQSRYSPRIRLN